MQYAWTYKPVRSIVSIDTLDSGFQIKLKLASETNGSSVLTGMQADQSSRPYIPY